MEINLDQIPTDTLRIELKKRVELEKSKKQERAKELKDIIQKSQEELRSLNNIPKTSKNKLPNVVKQFMPKDLKQSVDDINDEITSRQNPNMQKSAASESDGDVNRCPNCGSTPSNWEHNERDGNVYCVCGQLILSEKEVNGNFR